MAKTVIGLNISCFSDNPSSRHACSAGTKEKEFVNPSSRVTASSPTIGTRVSMELKGEDGSDNPRTSESWKTIVATESSAFEQARMCIDDIVKWISTIADDDPEGIEKIWNDELRVRPLWRRKAQPLNQQNCVSTSLSSGYRR